MCAGLTAAALECPWSCRPEGRFCRHGATSPRLQPSLGSVAVCRRCPCTRWRSAPNAQPRTFLPRAAASKTQNQHGWRTCASCDWVAAREGGVGLTGCRTATSPARGCGWAPPSPRALLLPPLCSRRCVWKPQHVQKTRSLPAQPALRPRGHPGNPVVPVTRSPPRPDRMPLHGVSGRSRGGNRGSIITFGQK